MLEKSSNHIYMQDRELSWLKFNTRVLEEAGDMYVPLMERLKFLSIFTTNLDEFFMIRVGGLFDELNSNTQRIDEKTGLTPHIQLSLIYEAIKPLYAKKDLIYFQIQNKLKDYNIYDFKYNELTTSERKRVENYYLKVIKSKITFTTIKVYDKFPHLLNNEIYIATTLKKDNIKFFGLAKIPSSLPRLYFLSTENSRFMRIESIILEFIEDVFKDYSVYDKTIIRVTRNGDLDLNNEDDVNITADIRAQMEVLLEKRTKLEPVRLELANSINDEIKIYLQNALGLNDQQIFISDSPVNLSYVPSLFTRLDDVELQKLLYPNFTPRMCGQIDINEPILPQIQNRDLLLSFPFESMKPFLNLIKESAYDESVKSIKITIYRLAEKTKLIEYLCQASSQGKEVTILIELLARFDEQNNINWSQKLEDAGCKVIYGFKGFKVHSKICLITKKEIEDGKLVDKYITQIGTGNFNETTVQLYTDLSLVTYNQEIGSDTAEFFYNMEHGELYGDINGRYKHLLIAPITFKDKIIDLIEGEILFGHLGRIFIKVNSLTDIDIINKLRDASRAGVQISLVVRGICCLLPGIAGQTENIYVTNIVGRFLEHSRIYSFGSRNLQKIYIASADLMTRNTTQRIEVACPILDDYVKSKINHLIHYIELDNVKARVLLPTGNYIEKPDSTEKISSQEILMRDAYYFEASMIEYRKREKYKKKFNFIFEKSYAVFSKFKEIYDNSIDKIKYKNSLKLEAKQQILLESSKFKIPYNNNDDIDDVDILDDIDDIE